MNKTILTFFSVVGWCYGVWLPVESITNRSGYSDITCRGNARSVAIDPFGNIHVTWRGANPDYFQVWYSRWDDSIRAWSADTVLSCDQGGVGDPAIACDSSGNVYIAWITSGLLKLKRWDSSTGEWQPEDTFRTGDTRDSAVSIAVARNGVVHLAWGRSGSGAPRQIFYVYYDGGWGHCDTIISLGSTDILTYPSIATAPDGNLMVVWYQYTHDHPAVIAKRRIDTVWTDVETVYSRREANLPTVCWARDTFHLVFNVKIPNSSDYEIFYRARGPEGWGDTFNVCPGFLLRATAPAIAGNEVGDVSVVWAGWNSINRDTMHVFYRRRMAGGGWDSIERVSIGQRLRDRVSIAAQMNRVEVVWSEKSGIFTWAVRGRRRELGHDLGVFRVEQPRDTVDSASTILPVAWVKNFGDFAEDSVPIWFILGDWVNVRQINSIGTGESLRVVFDSVVVHSRNQMVAVCSVRVAEDMVPRNNCVESSFFVRVRDVAVESILTPQGRMPEDSIRPEVVVQNRGNVLARFFLACSIFIGVDSLVYADTLTVTMGPNVRSRIRFRCWYSAVGDYLLLIRAVFPGDMHPENDSISCEFTIIRHDVGIARLVFPVGVVDSGWSGYPKAVVNNYGTETESFLVFFRIGTEYLDSLLITGLRPGDSLEAVFVPWEAQVRGRRAVCCSTCLDSDRCPDNDIVRDTVFVRVRDVGTVEITSPGEVANPGAVQPEALVKNFGNEAVDFRARCEIFDSAGGRVYLDSSEVLLSPESSAVVTFPLWWARGGWYSIQVATTLNGDMRRENDSISKQFYITRSDGAVVRVLAPVGTITEGIVTPVAVVANFGERRGELWTYFAVIQKGESTCFEYFDSSSVVLDAGAQREIFFREWLARPGRYFAVASCNLIGDENPANDTIREVVTVESVPFQRWKEKLPLPLGPKIRPVMAGGCLVGTRDKVFALKGRSDEWLSYDVSDEKWEGRKPVPGGLRGKKPKSGAAVCWDGGHKIFLLKGGNTREFWFYDINQDSWFSLPDLPEYTTNIRYGSGLAFVRHRDTSRVFCLKGSGTDEFLVYLVDQNEWHSRRPVPAGMLNKRVKRGSALAAVGTRIFCIKGSTNELYEYLIARDTWQVRAQLPFSGSNGSRRCKEGAALTSDGERFIYAFKGGRTVEFWRYDVLLDRWDELEPIPLGNYGRRIETGAALAFNNKQVYALKGRGSREFWSYETESLSSLSVVCAAGAKSEKNRTIKSKRETVGERLIVFDIAGRGVCSNIAKPGVYFIFSPQSVGIRRKTVIVGGRKARRLLNFN
ncbi:MAG: hypothetical protein ACUVUD_00840 [bacterium]